ncbi:MAG: RNA methyltransferase [Pseudomonadota bacterium]
MSRSSTSGRPPKRPKNARSNPRVKRNGGDAAQGSKGKRPHPRNGSTTSKPRSAQPRQASEKRSAPDRLFLYGQHTVRAALSNPDRRKFRLILTDNALARLGYDSNAHAVKALSQTWNNPAIEVRSAGDIAGLVSADAVHQGIALECAPLDTLDASELFNLVDAKTVLALDQITDPHNVGAILRTAVAMNVDAVLITHRNSANETAVLAKSASGALDFARVVDIRNMSKALAELNAMGFMSIGLDSEGPLVLEDTLQAVQGRPVVLVLGAEGKGLREKTRETCTHLARLDMPGAIKSLNVSNAAALALYLVSHR